MRLRWTFNQFLLYCEREVSHTDITIPLFRNVKTYSLRTRELSLSPTTSRTSWLVNFICFKHVLFQLSSPFCWTRKSQDHTSTHGRLIAVSVCFHLLSYPSHCGGRFAKVYGTRVFSLHNLCHCNGARHRLKPPSRPNPLTNKNEPNLPKTRPGAVQNRGLAMGRDGEPKRKQLTSISIWSKIWGGIMMVCS